MNMLLISCALSVIGALAALVAGKSEDTSKVLACAFGVAAAALAILAGFIGAFVGEQAFVCATPFAGFNFHIAIGPLSGLLLIVINILALVAWIYGLSYFHEYAGKGIGAIGFFMNLFVVSMNMVLCAESAFWFLVFFELMSLTSYFLVIIEQEERSIRGGFLYFVMAHVGFFMIMMSYLIMAAKTGSFEFADFRATEFGSGTASLVFMLAFLGFGCKAGMFPFHSWLPQAHPAAPSNVSALMSGGMIKIGVFGIVKVGMDLLGASQPQLWWGIVVLIIGALSSVLGVAYALGEHDIKKLLAYHSVENIGIILLGVGVGYIGLATGNTVVAALGLMAGLYHLLNHAMFKGLLFLGAGSVLYATGTRNMEVMGGLAKAMPTTAMCFLIGSLAISAIPPLNGFVSEWFTYQSLFSTAMAGGAALKLFAAFAAVSLAITGALAVTCFVKAYGVTFLSAPRSDVAANAKEVPVPMRVGMVILAVICVCLGLGAPLVAPALENLAAAIMGSTPATVSAGIANINPALGSVVSTPLLAVIMLVFFLLACAIRNLFACGGQAADREPWACGYAQTTDMPVVATSFASQVRMFLTPLYTARTAIAGTSTKFAAAFTALVEGTRKAEPLPDKYLVDTTGSFVTWLGRKVQGIEAGKFRVYIVYIVVMLLAFLVLAAVVK